MLSGGKFEPMWACARHLHGRLATMDEMRKREERRKLAVRRERLRLLADLSSDVMAGVAGGGWEWGAVVNYTHGTNARSNCC